MADCGEITLPKMKGTEIAPGIWLLEEPHPVAGSNRLRCLAEVGGALAVIELSLKFSHMRH